MSEHLSIARAADGMVGGAHGAPMCAEVVRRRLVVFGRVQGVFFRDSTRRQAEARGVSGWAANRRDGSVEVVLEGPRAAVEEVAAYSRRGPERAQVDHVEEREESPEGLDGFAVR